MKLFLLTLFIPVFYDHLVRDPGCLVLESATEHFIDLIVESVIHQPNNLLNIAKQSAGDLLIHSFFVLLASQSQALPTPLLLFSRYAVSKSHHQTTEQDHDTIN